MDKRIKKLSLVLFISLVLPLSAGAADKSDNFVVKGAGQITCATFTAEREKLSQGYFEVVAWVMGYVSAYNSLSPDTYDVTPWQSADTLSVLLASHCASHPEEPFFVATAKLINTLAEDRLQRLSGSITIKSEEESIALYKDVIFRLQASLKDKGYLKVKWPSGDFDDETVLAVKAFQKAKELKPTGLPDQNTLYHLFSKE